MKKITLFVSSLLVLGTSFAQSQSGRTCGTKVPDAAWEEWFSQKVQERVDSRTPIVNYTIPVIIHIIHRGTAVGTDANISNAQAISQLAVLNADYGGTNVDVSNIPAIFNSVKAGDTGIRFCLAKTDPGGNVLAETGIERINGVTKGWKDTDTMEMNPMYSYFQQVIKPNTIWNPKKYLNIWLADIAQSQLLGYAAFPSGSTNTGLDGVENLFTTGVVVYRKAWGNTGDLIANYNKGRTATHEVGHWLGLRHIWGDDSCATDYCNDTPFHEKANFGSPTHPHNVGGCAGNTTGEMFMNYMDYVNDKDMFMFSADQRNRMQTTMANGYFRTGLTNSHRCDAPFTYNTGIETIKFPAPKSYTCLNTVAPIVQLVNEGTTPLTAVTIKFGYDGAAAITYNWTGTLAKFAKVNVTLPVSAALTVGAHKLTVSTSMPNNNADLDTINDKKAINFYIGATQTSSLKQGFEGVDFAPANWTIINLQEDIAWSRDTTVGGFGTSKSCAVFDNYSTDIPTNGYFDDMQSPKFNFTGVSKAKLTFEVAHRQYNANTNDSLSILASTDCGATWTSIYGKGGARLSTKSGYLDTLVFVPTATQWRKDSIDLAAYTGKASVSFLFRNVSDWGQPIYLDNINIAADFAIGYNDALTLENALVIYPNPNDGNFNLGFNAINKSTYKIQITNTLGQLVYNEELKNFSGNYSNAVNIATYGKGVYTVSITNTNNQSVKKVIVY